MMPNRIVFVRDHEDNLKVFTNFCAEVYRVLDLGEHEPKPSEADLSFRVDGLSDGLLMVDPIILAPAGNGRTTEFDPKLVDDVATHVNAAMLQHERAELERWLATAEEEFGLFQKEIVEKRKQLEELTHGDAARTVDQNKA
jgi:hypothetical protein